MYAIPASPINDGTIIRLSDLASIPPDEANLDYQSYLAWVSEGNVAPPYEPASEPEPEPEPKT